MFNARCPFFLYLCIPKTKTRLFFIKMNVSYKWLKDYVDFDLTPDEVSKALTSVGLEVESLEEVQSVKGGLAGLVVAQVLTCEPHPDSDHMHVCTVDLGEGRVEQIVCGAPNCRQGLKTIAATLSSMMATRSLSSRSRNCVA